MPTYDLELFKKLNDEWRDRPLVAVARKAADAAELYEQSRRRADNVVKHIDLRGKRVLEIGCGRGYFVRLLTDEYDCDAVGFDVTEYPDWAGDRRFTKADVAETADLGSFDVILSHAVWEHVRHPYTALVNQRKMLAADGVVYLYANLSRGAKASHRYREIYFPWPHLLFTDDVIEAYYESIGHPPSRAAWVNHLTFAQYVDHFERIGYGITKVWPSRTWWDEEFYQQHYDVLSRYPQWDLQHDFIHAVLTKQPAPAPAPPGQTDAAKVRALEKRLARIETSASWRVTAPLRQAARLVRGR